MVRLRSRSLCTNIYVCVFAPVWLHFPQYISLCWWDLHTTHILKITFSLETQFCQFVSNFYMNAKMEHMQEKQIFISFYILKLHFFERTMAEKGSWSESNMQMLICHREISFCFMVLCKRSCTRSLYILPDTVERKWTAFSCLGSLPYTPTLRMHSFLALASVNSFFYEESTWGKKEQLQLLSAG